MKEDKGGQKGDKEGQKEDKGGQIPFLVVPAKHTFL